MCALFSAAGKALQMVFCRGNFLPLVKVSPSPFKEPLEAILWGFAPNPTHTISTLLRKAAYGGWGIFPIAYLKKVRQKLLFAFGG